jgi:putative hydroxymethylpyrimidine transport system ATP-binding protein
MTPAPAIDLKKISFTYAGHYLFENLSMHLPAGKSCCLLGPSGVGKSSLLQLIAGILPLSNQMGEIVAADGKALIGRVAYMAQTDLLMPWRTLLDNVLIGERLRQTRWQITKETKERALYHLQQVGLQDKAYDKPIVLSHGMRQRVALARTLFEDKPIVLMDEPFSALDVVRKMELQALAVEKLRDRTVFWVTHDPLEALRVSHHIFVLTGLPAKINYSIQLNENLPRDVRQPEIMALEAQLIDALCYSGNEIC